MAMYRYFACMLSLEGLFSTYISSSSGHSTGLIEVSLHVPTQNYEELMIEALQTEGFHYMTSDHALRPEKIKAIADDPDFQKYAEVCFNSGKQSENCGKCYGCWKTMIPLDQIGKLDLFSESFDLREYYADRKKVFRDLIEFSRMPEADSARETVAQILELAKTQPNETGKEFMEVYDSMQI